MSNSQKEERGEASTVRSRVTPVAEAAAEIAIEAYIFGYPLVMMETTRLQMTNVEPPQYVGGLGAPMNQFVHLPAFPDAKFTEVVRPNADTLYSILWFDVSGEPLVIHVPDSGGRYYLLQMLDLSLPGPHFVPRTLGSTRVGTGCQGTGHRPCRRVDSCRYSGSCRIPKLKVAGSTPVSRSNDPGRRSSGGRCRLGGRLDRGQLGARRRAFWQGCRAPVGSAEENTAVMSIAAVLDRRLRREQPQRPKPRAAFPGDITMSTTTIDVFSAPTTTTRTSSAPWRRRIGWTLSGLAILFLLFDSVIKLAMIDAVVTGSAELGYPVTTMFPIGLVLLACVLVYATPRTAIIGAVLLTGYLGGAIATHVRVENPLFSHILFPVYVAVFIWGGLYLRDPRLRNVLGRAR